MKAWKPALAAVLAAMIAFFVPLPYFISYPGDATSTEQLIDVEGATKEPGDLMMLTIAQRRATPYFLVESLFLPFADRSSVSDYLYDGESDTQYEKRQKLYMEEAQHNATIEGYELAGKKATVDFKGIYVSGIIPDGPADGKLKAGDQITAVGDEAITSLSGFMETISSKKAGTEVELTFLRNKKQRQTNIKVSQLTKESERVGLGIYEPLPMSSVKTDPEVDFNVKDVGGPSAGMMFTLEIYDQLTKGDLAKGYKIAGTGTIEEGGKVGPIGGAWQKVVAADEADAEIMFVPSGENYKEAKPSIKKIETNMKLVPIKTVEDALDYLEALPAK
ncbi:PDZ domain-containing protein [Exiguobacterium sp. Helios]|uniref:SepM family pheromone-processing serine protease n=1 Tax=unclassified Exiguobacterium TaxID=2644629 RepID=UPI00104D37ED|nr:MULTISPECIES: SepM family pheromone-processing serine protease [unclassified Exiguobacterium]QNR21564.1 PDZ domain-containing protein [Exiguobacterium sp. Helios]